MIYLFYLLFLFLCSCRGQEVVETPRFDLRPYGDLGGEFTLVDKDGQSVALEDLRGRTALLFFGYTYCPDFCPTTISRLVRVKELLGERADRELTLVFISVDPERDTPDVLRQYLDYFPVDVVGLTGSRKAIDDAVERYGAEYTLGAADADGHYAVDHSTSLYLIDTVGRVRYVFAHDARPENIAAASDLLWSGAADGSERLMADDALWQARDLGTYGCGAVGQGVDEAYRFWSTRRENESSSAKKRRLQPAFNYGLDR